MLYKFDGFIYTNEFDPAFPGYKKNGKYVPLHNYIYWLHTGLVPEKGKTAIHHIDEDRNNNEFENLELITLKRHHKHHCQTIKSRKINSISSQKNQWKGVHLDKRRNPEKAKCWNTKISFNNRKTWLGSFPDPLSAEIVYEFVWNEIYG